MSNIFNLTLLEAKLKGVGEKSIEKLKKMGIKTVRDVFYFFPRDYEDAGVIRKIRETREEEFAVIKGSVIKSELLRARNRLSYFKAAISDETGIMEAVWFKMPYLKNSIKTGDILILKGKVKKEFGVKMVNPSFVKAEEESEAETGKASAIYPLISEVSSKLIKTAVSACIERFLNEIEEIIPEKIREKQKLISRKEAFFKIHLPEKTEEAKAAKKYFAFEEIFLLELFIVGKRGKPVCDSERELLGDKKELVKKFISEIGFTLTNAQKRVIKEIYDELKSGKTVNRLIQGDVGSGKTIVAIILLLYMVENGYQGAFMAPTEILAEQHYISMVDVLMAVGIRVEVLTGSIKGAKRDKLIAEIEHGLVDIVVGTHALIEESVKFKNLGFIVIDEQHRFGVKQRQKIRDKGVVANLVVMSATPIPRSLALTVYGDLDVSIIDELPPGRKEIKTKWLKTESEFEKLSNFIKKKIDEGRQCYFVTPLIEESEKLDLTSAQELYETVAADYFANYKSALLHGKMSWSEKESIMRKFKKGHTDILVSTTVIEVGVNVPNAVIMVIMNAERFGLAQLHQLRGRVGRGSDESYCFMVSYSKNEETAKRLGVMESTTDGFKIAEEDLKLRKSGEIFGTRQSGISDLRLVDITRDIKLIKSAKDEAESYLSQNGWEIESAFLKEEIEKRYGKKEEKLGG